MRLRRASRGICHVAGRLHEHLIRSKANKKGLPAEAKGQYGCNQCNPLLDFY